MEGNKVHYRHLMLFFYWKGKNATQAVNKIFAIYGDGAIADRTVQKWFAMFKTGDFNLEDQIKTLIENDSRYTTRELTEMLKISNTTIHEHFVKLGCINHFDVCAPRDLTEKDLMDRISICDSLYKPNKETLF